MKLFLKNVMRLTKKDKMFAILKNIINFEMLVNDRSVDIGNKNTFRKRVQIKPMFKFLLRSGTENIGFLFGFNQTNHTYSKLCLDQANTSMQDKYHRRWSKTFCRALFLFSSFKIVFVISYFSSLFFCGLSILSY